MKVVNLASSKSAWRGYEYYQDGHVLSYEKDSEGIYHGKVRGSDNNVYDVVLNMERPRNSTCNCPFAYGRHVVCKHAVALYFAIFPDDAVAYKAKVDKEQAEYEEWLDGLPDRVEAYVRKLSKSQLQKDLLDILFGTEDWILDRYIRDHDIDDEY